MKNLENWILENHPEYIGIQNETKDLIELARATGDKVSNGFLAYPTIRLDEVGPFFQRLLFFKKEVVKTKNGDATKFMFAIPNCTGMESGNGNFHFWIFSSTLESTLTYSGFNMDSPRPVPFVLIYEGQKVSEKGNGNSYHSFSAISIKDSDSLDSYIEDTNTIVVEEKKTKKSVK